MIPILPLASIVVLTVEQAPKDDFLGISKKPFAHPPVLNDNGPLLGSYMRNAHSIVTLMLEHLNNHLGLPPATLTNLHRQYAVSGDHVRFIKSPPQPQDTLGTSMGAHTDFGSITILFNRVGGLQVFPPGENADWRYVKPLPGHCIVNLGDAMVKFTNGLLRSNIHRVTAPPGEQVSCTRYSLVYFARPEDEVKLKRLEGSSVIPPLEDGVVEEDIRSVDWIRDKATAKRTGVYTKESEKRSQL
jgi:isopenicillin N synthase-like dioxygenase